MDLGQGDKGMGVDGCDDVFQPHDLISTDYTVEDFPIAFCEMAVSSENGHAAVHVQRDFCRDGVWVFRDDEGPPGGIGPLLYEVDDAGADV